MAKRRKSEYSNSVIFVHCANKKALTESKSLLQAEHIQKGKRSLAAKT